MDRRNDAAERLLPTGTEWTPVRWGESGDRVFRRNGGGAYAKISSGKGAVLLDNERSRTEWLAAFSIGSPTVLDWIASEEGACLVTSAVPGVPASDLSAPDLRLAWPSMVRQLKLLHDLPAGGCPFHRRLETMFHRAADVVARDAVNPDFLDPEFQDTPPSKLLADLRRELPQRLTEESRDLVICHGDACLPNFMVDPETHNCTGLIDLGRLGTADRYVDFSLLLGSARESWVRPDDAQIARDRLFDIHGISAPDLGRLAFYLRLDPLTWG
ncbi:APH(3'') family aminoglycoside O-phosphotransferase [Sinorhizobium numidicum]|uniref:Aminoglycoside 3'-phosphotransferase n=1 Tax=Sinorhizobium numidicum TaxID=680248 RepID=A0ABY8CX37_9HYPH|nr:APH(3'') family aminoglycoside O-phosphotransferase [Sinorhizobium numidicum]WEX76549.1 APH(3'') family aminoglycoside O-phosphotransferase [Sinorhizobium numidicum]WEX83210.1 APH(3'') family aminoglycoside O-phosphotransferase [Sinorhizobium numidicum]